MHTHSRTQGGAVQPAVAIATERSAASVSVARLRFCVCFIIPAAQPDLFLQLSAAAQTDTKVAEINVERKFLPGHWRLGPVPPHLVLLHTSEETEAPFIFMPRPDESTLREGIHI